jgi:hypothetical protein
MRVIHHLLVSRGLGAGNEYTSYTPAAEVDVIMKLMNTIAVWRREHGQAARVRVEPEELVADYDESQGHRCEFQLISTKGEYLDFERTRLKPEPGAAYIVLPKIRQGEKVRLRLRMGAATWQSRYPIDPFVGGVHLEVRR